MNTFLRTTLYFFIIATYSLLSSLPLAISNPLIAVDVGHSKHAYGALSASGISEFNFNAILAKDIIQELSSNGINSFTIGEKGNIIKLHERTQIANSKNATFLISIHHDSVQPQYLKKNLLNGKTLNYCNNFSGFSLFVSRLNPKTSESLRCASAIGEALRQEGFQPTQHHAEKIIGENKSWADKKNGVYFYDKLAVLKNVNCPAVLIEAGIIVNQQDEGFLQNPQIRKAIASAIKKGLAGCALK